MNLKKLQIHDKYRNLSNQAAPTNAAFFAPLRRLMTALAAAPPPSTFPPSPDISTRAAPVYDAARVLGISRDNSQIVPSERVIYAALRLGTHNVDIPALRRYFSGDDS
jgi:hypothetical protein